MPPCLYLTHRARLLALAQARGCDLHEAEDLTHEVFAKLLRTQRWAEITALPEVAQAAVLARRLHSQLLNRWRDQHRHCRDSSRTVTLEDLPARTLTHDTTPAHELDRRWAHTQLDHALTQLRAELSDLQWLAVRPTLHDDEPREGPAKSNRVALCRARKRLRSMVDIDEVRSAMLACG